MYLTPFFNLLLSHDDDLFEFLAFRRLRPLFVRTPYVCKYVTSRNKGLCVMYIVHIISHTEKKKATSNAVT